MRFGRYNSLIILFLLGVVSSCVKEDKVDYALEGEEWGLAAVDILPSGGGEDELGASAVNYLQFPKRMLFQEGGEVHLYSVSAKKEEVDLGVYSYRIRSQQLLLVLKNYGELNLGSLDFSDGKMELLLDSDMAVAMLYYNLSKLPQEELKCKDKAPCPQRQVDQIQDYIRSGERSVKRTYRRGAPSKE